MDNIKYYKPVAVWRNPHLWYITALMMACLIFYYLATIMELMGWLKLQWWILYTVHDLHRLLFLIPVVYAAYIFRVRGVIVTVLISGLIFLPRAIFLSPYPQALLRPMVLLIAIGMIGFLLSRLLAGITERKLAVEALRESRDYLERLTNSMWDAVFEVKMPERVIEWANDSFKLIGYDLGECIGETTEFLYLDESEFLDFGNKLKNVIAAGKDILHAEQLLKRESGEVFPAEITATISKEKGEIVRVTSIVRDITERKRAEEEIKSLAKFPSENPNPVLRVAKDGTILYANKMSSTLLGVWGCQVGQLLPEYLCQSILDVLGSGLHKYIEVECGEQTFSFIFAPVVDAGYVNLYGRDITERRQAEEREKLLQQELYLSSRLASIGELAAGVAHEINNPLTGVLGFSQRLLRKSTDEEVRQDLERIHDGALRAAKVVGNLLAFARRRETKKQYADINDIVQKALELRAYELKTGNIEVATDLAPGLPQIMADFHQLQEVCLNIILNAEQVMTEAKGGGRLSLKTELLKGYVRISFTDDGPGIPAKNLTRLFDPFFTTRGERGGTGLGLSICHGIVTEHGGRIYARSKPGKGATFLVELPVTAKKIDEVKAD